MYSLHFLKCEYLLVFLIFDDSKLNTFWVWDCWSDKARHFVNQLIKKDNCEMNYNQSNCLNCLRALQQSSCNAGPPFFVTLLTFHLLDLPVCAELHDITQFPFVFILTTKHPANFETTWVDMQV